MSLDVLSNLIGYQLVWFIVVSCAGNGRVWPAVAAELIFLFWQLVISRRRLSDLKLMALAVVLGILIDGGLAAFNLSRYASATPAVPPGGAPLWIVALWACFSTTVPKSLKWLRGRKSLAFVFGAIGAPLAYLGAQRGWSAVTLVAPEWRGILWLAITWGISIVLMLATLVE